MSSIAERVAEAEAQDRPPVVLVVEDEVLIRMAIADYLRDCAYTVIEAGKAEEALELFAAAVTVDVVFTDVNLGGEMNGFALARWVRENRPGLPVILTSSASNAAEAASDVCGAGPLIEKPYPVEHVGERIKALLAARAAAPPPSPPPDAA